MRGCLIAKTGYEPFTRKVERISSDPGHKTYPVANITRLIVYFFLAPLPAAASFLITVLMTPTATVCLMSRTAKRPRGG